MSQATLSTKLQTEIQAINGTADDTVQLKKMTDAIAKAVVDWLEQDAISGPGNFQAGGDNVSGTGDLTG